ncbi:MAG: MotA/TolQ/ExbB proton channel family protein [SAR324 cluster bacterium]|nr:MotA/TolQ/ExbB proton channel family protein [SAR324 cluster bacterium]MCZ6749226.1 MotA/TolQ/ExbB proton channel family protein [SAR324 cluster bacterium]
MLESGSIWSLVFTGDWVSLLVLTVLAGMSVLSWAIILIKWVQFRRIRGENNFFKESFKRRSTLRDISEIANRLHISPLARMFEGSYRELNTFRSNIEKVAGTTRDSADKLLMSPDYRDRLLVRLNRAQERIYNDQYAHLDRWLPMLAMVSSSAPFIGLFGTVLGIIDAFRNIGLSGLTSLAVVAPGISEALVATAGGLVAAIPALVAYNLYRNSIRDVSIEMKNFALDITNRLDRML